jgi:hypothetical protein
VARSRPVDRDGDMQQAPGILPGACRLVRVMIDYRIEWCYTNDRSGCYQTRVDVGKARML